MNECCASLSSNDSFIKQHAETTDHDVHPNYVQILERGVDNLTKRLFLESWHSTINPNCVNERKPFPRAYLPIVKAFKVTVQFERCFRLMEHITVIL